MHLKKGGNMPKKVVLTCSGLLPIEITQKLNQWFEVKNGTCLSSKTDLIKILWEAEGYILGGSEHIDREVLEKTNLKWIIFIGMQWETFFSPEARGYLKAKNIPVYATGGGVDAVIETTLEEIKNPWHAVENFHWRLPENYNLKEQSVSVIGAGRIGSGLLKKINRKCKQLVYFEPFGEKPELSRIGIGFEPNLGDAISGKDIVSLHLAYIPLINDNIIKWEQLKGISQNGLFINNARAELVKANDFLRFLENRKDVSSIWDVFYVEGSEYTELFNSAEPSVYKSIAKSQNFFFTGHTASTRHPELSAKEYGAFLIKVIEDNKLRE